VTAAATTIRINKFLFIEPPEIIFPFGNLMVEVGRETYIIIVAEL